MNRISRNISIILRAERMIARRNMAVLRNQTGLMVFAALIGAIGLVMLNVASFFWLSSTMSPQAAALIIAVANLVLAAIVVVVASRKTAQPELEPLTEVRDLAIEDLETELQGMVDDLRDVAANVRRVASNPLGTALPALAVPLVSSLLKSLSKNSGKKS